jgi:hypothetical protein
VVRIESVAVPQQLTRSRGCSWRVVYQVPVQFGWIWLWCLVGVTPLR